MFPILHSSTLSESSTKHIITRPLSVSFLSRPFIYSPKSTIDPSYNTQRHILICQVKVLVSFPYTTAGKVWTENLSKDLLPRRCPHLQLVHIIKNLDDSTSLQNQLSPYSQTQRTFEQVYAVDPAIRHQCVVTQEANMISSAHLSRSDHLQTDDH